MKACLLTQIAPENRLLNRLGPEARTARSAFVAVSFIQRTGMKHLFKSLKVLLDKDRPVSVYTSGYLGITDPEALNDLLRLCGHYESLQVFFNAEDRFHTKFFFFAKPADAYSLFLGSSNVSVGGFADTGELNVHIRGKTTDAVCRDIQTVMANLEKNRNFEPLSEEAIRAYRKQHGSRRARKAPHRKRAKVYLPLVEMPILVLDREFSTDERDRIERKHPEWDNYVSYSSELKGLKRGDHFLRVSKGRGEKPTFTASRYVEHDRVSSVGTIASVEDGDWLPLARLAKLLKMEEKKLLREKKLNVYRIAILQRDFPKSFA